MKEQFLNRESTQKDLKYYNKQGVLIYLFCILHDKVFVEYTYDSFGNPLYYRNSNGDWLKHTRCKETGKELTYEDSDGYKTGFELKTPHLDEIIKTYKIAIKLGCSIDNKEFKAIKKQLNRQ